MNTPNYDSDAILEAIERDGYYVLPTPLLSGEALAEVQREWRKRVTHMAHNGQPGYEARDPFRRIVHDVLTVSPHLTRAALHPALTDVMRRYIGPEAALTESKGWRTMPTEVDFHGWHNDAWYDPSLEEVPRQLKVAIYLSDVTSGAFAYAPGTHGQRRHRHYSEAEVDAFERDPVVFNAPAGTAIIFDVSGVHRQTVPVLTERDAVFLVYHDPKVALQPDDVMAARYRPAVVPVDALDGMSHEQLRLLGVGRQELRQAMNPSGPRDLGWRSALARAEAGYHAFNKLRSRVEARLRR